MRNPELNLKTRLEIFISNRNIDCNSTLWIDLFCGAGGTSTGIHLSKNNHHVLACVNHDENAIKSHFENHPFAFHFTEDIRDFEVVRKLTLIVNEIRQLIPGIKINLWASLECTNFSKAKGGLPRDADSRTLAEHMNMYIDALGVDYFYVENVREFMAWGPLDENGKPISRKNGQDFLRWKKEIENFGYKSQYKILNSADFGSYQSRERLFMIFAKNGNPFFWPEQTHAKNGSDNDLFGIKKHKAVRDILELEKRGVCIFSKKRSDKTYERIFKGLLKEGKDYFLTSYYGNGNAHSIDKPIGTITCKDRYALHFINYDYSNATSSSIEKPIGSVTTIPKQNLVTIDWLTDTQYGRTSISIDKPCVTIIARQDKKPLYKLSAELGTCYTKIDDEDSEIVKKIKDFMNKNFIKSIYIRMLFIPELLQAQGFPKDYKLVGTQTEQKKYIGNAVEVNMAKALISAIQHS